MGRQLPELLWTPQALRLTKRSLAVNFQGPRENAPGYGFVANLAELETDDLVGVIPTNLRCSGRDLVDDCTITPSSCLGTASHQSYRHTHAYLSFCRKESKFWEIPEKTKLKGQGESEGWRPGFVRSREREMLQAMGNVFCIHVFMLTV